MKHKASASHDEAMARRIRKDARFATEYLKPRGSAGTYFARAALAGGAFFTYLSNQRSIS
jgi:hypothetical protein